MADETRTRGRPRITNSGRTERRRKQLREAQQAYRTRRQNTIVVLQNRVNVLESGVEQLSQLFLSFSDLLLEAGLLGRYPHVASALQKVTKQCVSLAKSGCDSYAETVAINGKSGSCDNSTSQNNLSPVIQAGLAQPDLILPTTKDSTELSPVSTRWIKSLPPPSPPHHDQNMLPFGMIHLTSSPISEVHPLVSAWPTPSFPRNPTGPQGSLPHLEKEIHIQGNMPTIDIPSDHLSEPLVMSQFEEAIFVQTLSRLSICLGNGPAIRRPNVEYALRFAIQVALSIRSAIRNNNRRVCEAWLENIQYS